jgi:hypothetical protein
VLLDCSDLLEVTRGGGASGSSARSKKRRQRGIVWLTSDRTRDSRSGAKRDAVPGSGRRSDGGAGIPRGYIDAEFE